MIMVYNKGTVLTVLTHGMYVCMSAQYTEPKCPIITNCNMKATKMLCMCRILQLMSSATQDILHTVCTNPMKE
jgi:hypothetical protein